MSRKSEITIAGVVLGLLAMGCCLVVTLCCLLLRYTASRAMDDDESTDSYMETAIRYFLDGKPEVDDEESSIHRMGDDLGETRSIDATVSCNESELE